MKVSQFPIVLLILPLLYIQACDDPVYNQHLIEKNGYTITKIECLWQGKCYAKRVRVHVVKGGVEDEFILGGGEADILNKIVLSHPNMKFDFVVDRMDDVYSVSDDKTKKQINLESN